MKVVKGKVHLKKKYIDGCGKWICTNLGLQINPQKPTGPISGVWYQAMNLKPETGLVVSAGSASQGGKQLRMSDDVFWLKALRRAQDKDWK